MPKIKTHSGAKKRFKLTKNKKIKYWHANKNHILTKKTSKRKRNLKKSSIVSQANEATIKALIPYAG